MDRARIIEETGSPGRRPSARRRWLVAATMATLAAPLMSGSAIALGGSSSAGSSTVTARPALMAPAPRHHCRHGDRGGAHRGTAYRAPQL